MTAGNLTIKTSPAVIDRRYSSKRVLQRELQLSSWLCRQNLPDAPVDFGNHVAKKAALGRAFEFVGDVQRHVRHAVRHIQEKRPILAFGDELHAVSSVAAITKKIMRSGVIVARKLECASLSLIIRRVARRRKFNYSP